MSQPLPEKLQTHPQTLSQPKANISPLCLQLLELIPQVIWLADAQGNLIHCNPAWQSYTGQPSSAACGNRFLDYFHADDRRRLSVAWENAIVQKQPMREKVRLRMVDGSNEWFLVTAKPIQSDPADTDLDVAWLGMMTRLASTAGDPNLIEGQAFLESVFENISDALVACNAEGKLVLFNRAAQAIHGLPPEPISSDRWAQYYDLYDGTGENTLAPENVPLFSALRGEKVRDAEMMIIPKNGNARSLVTNADPIYDKTGQQLGAVAMMRDVTEYRRTIADLEMSERRFQAIFNQTFQFIGLLSPDGTLLEANQTALNFGGFEAADVVNRPFWKTGWWPEALETRAKLQAAIARAANGEFIRYEVDVLGKDNQIVTIDFSLSPVYDSKGKVILLIPEGRDISDRKKIEAKLRTLNAELEDRVAERTQDLEHTIQRLQQKTQQLEEQEAQFRSTFEQVAMGCAHVDLDGRWRRVNQKLCDITGYSREELLDKTFQDITHPDDLAEDLDYVNQLLAGKISHYRLDKRYLREDSSAIWVKITVSLERQHRHNTAQALGKPLYFVVMVEDISERKQLERRDVENRAALEKAKAALEKRNYDLDQFVYIASHDLKAPLRGIMNLSQWLEEDLSGQLPAENQAQLELIQKRVQRMAKLIDGLLEYSRVGREQLPVEPVDSHQLLLEVIDLLAPPSNFRVSIPSKMPTLPAKRILLSQVFANLISNAIKHHDRQTGCIEVGWHNHVSYYQFLVIDDGPGIPPAQHERIFGVFQTLSDSDAPDNTGIGLALIRKIIESEGGTIQIHSDGIRGCRFEFTWPKLTNYRNGIKKAAISD